MMFGYVSGYNQAPKELAPLLWCLGFAVENRVGKPVDYLLRGLFTDDDDALGGGEPGWSWYREKQADGSHIYHVWTYDDVSGLDPCEGEYDEVAVKHHVREALLNFAQAHPDRKSEIDEVIARYSLNAHDEC